MQDLPLLGDFPEAYQVHLDALRIPILHVWLQVMVQCHLREGEEGGKWLEVRSWKFGGIVATIEQNKDRTA
jgi:hypothetical protein